MIYVELSKAKVKDRRNVVISECSKGGFTIAQQLEVSEGDRKTNVFLKGAIHIDNVNGLMNLRDALNYAIMECGKVTENDRNDEVEAVSSEESDEVEDTWDE